MQSLYAYILSQENDSKQAEIIMLKHFDEVIELKLSIISLLVELVDYAEKFYDKGKKKYFPSEEDLNPNRKFINNKIINLILEDNKLMKEIKRHSGIWLRNDHDVINKLFVELYKSELYKKYLDSNNQSLDFDKRFIIDILNEYILKNKLVHHIFEERSIYWMDDLPFIATIIFGNIKDDTDLLCKAVFKDHSDKEFALGLFRNTINNNKQYEDIIQRFATNWDLDRIAVMDQLLLKMAFAEILSMPELPIKVSINEYIEISKYYSTVKSKLFVNGLLDNFVKTYTSEGKIKKLGRGLV